MSDSTQFATAVQSSENTFQLIPDDQSPNLMQLYARARAKFVQLAKAETDSYDDRLFENAEGVLATLPLSTDGYALLIARLRNAERYARQREFGACRFELKLICSSLQSSQSVFQKLGWF